MPPVLRPDGEELPTASVGEQLAVVRSGQSFVVAAADDGSFYINDGTYDKIYKVDPQGVITIFAENPGFSYTIGIDVDPEARHDGPVGPDRPGILGAKGHRFALEGDEIGHRAGGGERHRRHQDRRVDHGDQDRGRHGRPRSAAGISGASPAPAPTSVSSRWSPGPIRSSAGG